MGQLYLQTGEIEQACETFESIMQDVPNFKDGARLVSCCHLLGDVEKMKKAFQLLLSVPPVVDEEKYSPAAHVR